MILVKEGNIVLTRGDTATINLDLKQGGQDFKPTADTEIIFSAKKSYGADTYAIHKKLSGGIIQIDHMDTQNLDVGDYVYDVQVRMGEQVNTVCSGKLKLTADVTRD